MQTSERSAVYSTARPCRPALPTNQASQTASQRACVKM